MVSLGFSGRVISKTPSLVGQRKIVRQTWVPKVRGDEIQEWLDMHAAVDSFVILDDDADMAHWTSRLVKTNYDVGLTDDDVEKAVKMLLG
jgi:hypothetical protein